MPEAISFTRAKLHFIRTRPVIIPLMALTPSIWGMPMTPEAADIAAVMTESRMRYF